MRNLGRVGVGLVRTSALLVLVVALKGTAAAASVPALGPETLVQAAGASQPIVRTFDQPSRTESACRLKVQNSPEPATRVTGATLTLNGQRVVSPRTFAPTVAWINKSVTLLPGNTLTATLKGEAGSFIQVSIVCPASHSLMSFC